MPMPGIYILSDFFVNSEKLMRTYFDCHFNVTLFVSHFLNNTISSTA